MPFAFEQQGTGISIMLGLDRPERGADINQTYPDGEGEKISKQIYTQGPILP